MRNSLAGKIIGLLVSIGLIIGGLSGTLVLRGTDSSMALVIVGFVFLAGDIYLLATHNKKKGRTTDLEAEGGMSPEALPRSMKAGMLVCAVSLPILLICGLLVTGALIPSIELRLPPVIMIGIFYGMALSAFAFVIGAFVAAGKLERKAPFLVAGIAAIPAALWFLNCAVFFRETYAMMRPMIFGISLEMTPRDFYSLLNLMPLVLNTLLVAGIIAMLLLLYRKMPKAGHIWAIFAVVLLGINIVFWLVMGALALPGYGNYSFGSAILGHWCAAVALFTMALGAKGAQQTDAPHQQSADLQE